MGRCSSSRASPCCHGTMDCQEVSGSWVRGLRSVQSAAHHNSQAAAIRCAAFLRDWLGPRIFAGRLSTPQLLVMQQFVPTAIVYSNKACFVAEPIKPGSFG